MPTLIAPPSGDNLDISHPPEPAKMDEIRRLLSERVAIKRELDSIDRAIETCAGVASDDQRPKRPRQSAKDFRAACGLS